MRILAYLILLGILYLSWTWTLRRALNNLTCTRTFSASAVFEGEEGQLVEVVRNDKGYVIPWLRLESYISPHIRLGRKDNLEVTGERYYRSLFTLMPYQQVRRTHHVTFLRRGAYNLGNASLTVGDVLGVCRFQRTQTLDVPLLVYPRLLSREELPVPVSRTLGELSRRRQLQEDPFLFRGIRPYQPGDPVRDIHWPATARTGDVQLRIHDHTARTRLLVVLNVQAQDDQWYDRLDPQGEQRIEYGISVAATVCVDALRQGLAAGFAANMPLDRTKETTLLLPMEGAAREEELLSAFARLQLVRTYDFSTLLDNLNAYSGLDVLVLSCYDNGEIRAAMRRLQRRGNQVSFHLLNGGGV